jgi:hypothetical protein
MAMAMDPTPSPTNAQVVGELLLESASRAMVSATLSMGLAALLAPSRVKDIQITSLHLIYMSTSFQGKK